MEQRQDLILGLLFIGLGVAAAWGASAYSGASGAYPLVLGVVMLLVGALIAVRALRSDSTHERDLVVAPINLIWAVALCSSYVALVVPLGFYSASLLLMLVLPAVLGFRRPVPLVLMALGFTALVFIVFTVVLKKPLPAEIWSSARMGGS